MLLVPPPVTLYGLKAVREGLVKQDLATGVFSQMPRVKPETFVLVSRVGGAKPDFASEGGDLLIECYAQQEPGAERLAGHVLAGLGWADGRVIDGRVLRWFRRSGPISYANPDTDRHYRFQLTGEIRVSL